MLKVYSYLLFLWNGGLSPESADLVELRERRILTGIILFISPAGLVIIATNVISGAATDNRFLLLGLILILAGLLVQAHFNSQRIAANFVLVAFWVMPTMIMRNYGVQGTTMMWLLPVSPLAVLLTGRRNGIAWAAICSVTYAVFGYLHSQELIDYIVINHEYVPGVGISNAIEAIMLTFILTGSAIIFRRTQRETEDKLHSLVGKLRNEILSRRLAEQEAKQSEQSKTAFLSAMSHEIRTPLNGVITATRLMVDSDSEQDKKQYADIVLDSSDTLLELVSNVMDLDAMESGKLKISNDVIRPHDLIQNSLRPFVFQAKEKGIDLTTMIDPDVPEYLLGDRTRSKQVIINLVGNAIKFTSEGHILVRLFIEHNMIVLIVEDTGIGISDQVKNKLFEPFVQADASTRENFGGTGLGLTIVKRIVSAMKGKISLESELGRGTKISVYFPYLKPSPESLEKAQRIKIEQKQLEPMNLLVADDNAVNRMVLSRLLENDSHKVVSVADGQQALDYLKAHPIDAVLLDIQMPVMNGEEAAAEIRCLEGPKSHIPIIAITANADSDDAKRLLETNFDSFLAKPFRHDELIEILQAARTKLDQLQSMTSAIRIDDITVT